MADTASRRSFLGLLAAAPLVLAAKAAATPVDATASITRLIEESRAMPESEASAAERMDFISRALLGVRYQADTLIGGPQQQEQLVVRDDAFDCFTFCEFVLAAALARDFAGFVRMLRAVRYEHGEVLWTARNHYFAEWCRHAVDKGICRPLAPAETVVIDKDVNWANLGRRTVSINGVSPAAVLANSASLANGDIIGFVSRRPNLDFFHTGLLIFDDDGTLLLRHASQRRRRVTDESLKRFVAANRVEHVTLLRAVEKTTPG